MIVWPCAATFMVVYSKQQAVLGEFRLPIGILALSYFLALTGVVRWARQFAL
jgi:hypothetical protein